MTSPRTLIALATWTHEHALELVVALVQAGRLDLARGLADAAGLDLDAWAEAARAELERRKQGA